MVEANAERMSNSNNPAELRNTNEPISRKGNGTVIAVFSPYW